MKIRYIITLFIFNINFTISQDSFVYYDQKINGTDYSFKMVPVTGGLFQMGSLKNEVGRFIDEGPVNNVEVSSFWIGAYEVTWELYELFVQRSIDDIVNNSKSVFFSGTTLYNSSDVKLEKHFIVKQVNVLPKINYLHFFNKKHFYKIFTQKNFNIVFENTNCTDNVNYDNFKKRLDSIEYIDVLFTKR